MQLKSGLYQHYKGPVYRVLHVAHHSETEEALVIYQAVYGDKGYWARPLSMFTERVSIRSEDGAVIKQVPRFNYLEEQTAVLEVAVLDVATGQAAAFEKAFQEAQSLIMSMEGYLSHTLRLSVDVPDRYLLTVLWQTLEAHTVGFRESSEYQRWRALLHHFYSPFPTVEHYSSEGVVR